MRLAIAPGPGSGAALTSPCGDSGAPPTAPTSLCADSGVVFLLSSHKQESYFLEFILSKKIFHIYSHLINPIIL